MGILSLLKLICLTLIFFLGQCYKWTTQYNFTISYAVTGFNLRNRICKSQVFIQNKIKGQDCVYLYQSSTQGNRTAMIRRIYIYYDTSTSSYKLKDTNFTHVNMSYNTNNVATLKMPNYYTNISYNDTSSILSRVRLSTSLDCILIRINNSTKSPLNRYDPANYSDFYYKSYFYDKVSDQYTPFSQSIIDTITFNNTYKSDIFYGNISNDCVSTNATYLLGPTKYSMVSRFDTVDNTYKAIINTSKLNYLIDFDNFNVLVYTANAQLNLLNRTSNAFVKINQIIPSPWKYVKSNNRYMINTYNSQKRNLFYTDNGSMLSKTGDFSGNFIMFQQTLTKFMLFKQNAILISGDTYIYDTNYTFLTMNWANNNSTSTRTQKLNLTVGIDAFNYLNYKLTDKILILNDTNTLLLYRVLQERLLYYFRIDLDNLGYYNTQYNTLNSIDYNEDESNTVKISNIYNSYLNITTTVSTQQVPSFKYNINSITNYKYTQEYSQMDIILSLCAESTFTYPTSSSLVLKSSQQFKWYSISYDQYDLTKPYNQTISMFQQTSLPYITGSKITYQRPSTLIYKSVNYTMLVSDAQQYNCSMYLSSSNNKTILLLSTNFNQTQSSLPFSLFNYNKSRLSVASDCSAFKIFTSVYVYNSTTKTYQFQATSSKFVYPSFDSKYKFAIDGGSLFTFGPNIQYYPVSITTGSGFNRKTSIVQRSYIFYTFYKIITSKFLTQNKFYISPDQTKIIILSYNIDNLKKITSYSIKLFRSKTSTWKQYTLNLDGDSLGVNPQVFFSDSYQIIGVKCKINAGPSNSYQYYFRFINYTSEKATEIPIPQQFINIQADSLVTLSSNYAYFRKVTMNSLLAKQFFETIYYFNKDNLSLTSVWSQIPTSSDIALFKQAKHIQYLASSTLSGSIVNTVVIYVYYVSEKVKTTMLNGTNEIIIYKKQISNLDQIAVMKNIVLLQTSLVSSSGMLALCTPGCIDCMNQNICKKCADGFTMITPSSRCQRCSPSCKTCSIYALNICLSCFSGFILDSGTCNKTCHSTCLRCTNISETSCTSCKAGTFLTTLNSCADCSSDCQICINQTKCTFCNYGYVLTSDFTCIICPLVCGTCNPNNIVQCLSCRKGFQLSIQNNITQCKLCLSNCKSCSNGICSQCGYGYTLANGTCLAKCRLPCITCDPQNATYCYSCPKSYKTVDGACIQSVPCNINISCTLCPFQYVLLNGMCNKCYQLPNCKFCSFFDLNKCSACQENYYLNDLYQCVRCNADCQICNNQIQCIKCKPGYTFSNSQTVSVCLPCKYPCGTCFESPQNCLSCSENYTLVGWKCIYQYNVNFIFQVTSNLDSITLANMNSIKKQICNTVGRPYTSFFFYSISQNQIKCMLEVENENDTVGISKLLKVIFKKNNDLYKFQIAQSFSLSSASSFSFKSPYNQGGNYTLQRSYQAGYDLNVFNFRASPINTVFEKIYFTANNPDNIESKSITLNPYYEVRQVQKRSLNCILVYQKLTKYYYLYRFINEFDPVLFAEITALFRSTTQTILIGDLCQSIKIDNIIYRWQTSFVQYDLPKDSEWDGPVFTKDLSFAVTQKGLYTFNSDHRAYYLIQDASNFENNQIYRYKNNVILFSYEPLADQNKYNYKVQIYFFLNQILTLVEKIQGTVLNIPQLIISPKSTKLIIYGLLQLQTPFIIGKYIQANQTRNIDLPARFKQSNLYIQLLDDYIYCRPLLENSQGIKQQAGYKILNASVLLLFSKTFLTLAQNTQIITSAQNIDQAHTLANFTHIFFANDQYSVYIEEINLIQTGASSVSTGYVQAPFSISKEIISSPSKFQWIYSIGVGPTKVFAIYYDPIQSTDFLQIKGTLDGNYSIIATTSGDLDCAIAYSEVEESLLVLQFDHLVDKKIKIVDDLYDKIVGTENIDIATATFKLNSQCKFLKINNLFYNRNTLAVSSPYFIKNPIVSAWSSAQFSKQFQFSVYNNDLYQLGQNNIYTKIISNLNSYQDNEIYTNSNKDKIVILSTSKLSQNSDSYQFLYIVRVFAFASEWKLLDTNISGLSYNQTVPEIVLSPQLNVLVLKYISDEEVYAYDIQYIDFTKQSAISIETPAEFLTVNLTQEDWQSYQFPFIEFTDNFLYYKEKCNYTGGVTLCLQIAFQFDIQNFLYKSMIERQITQTQVKLFKHSHLHESILNLKIYYEVDIMSSLSTMIRVQNREISLSEKIRNQSNQITIYSTGNYYQNSQYYFCSVGCFNCLNFEKCFQCAEGFAFDITKFQCIRCNYSCKACQFKSLQVCTECWPGFFYNQNYQCQKCAKQCLQCQDGPQNCTACSVGSYVDQTLKCMSCIPNCQQCDNEKTCLTCILGYVVVNTGFCVKCPLNCVQCEPARINHCLSCSQGFEQVKQNNITGCTKCPHNCFACKNGSCLQCKTGYRLIDSICYQKCQSPCKQCNLTNPTQCLSCLSNYILKSKKCVQNVQCNFNSTCFNCPFFYNLYNGQCLKCGTLNNCRYCSTDNLYKCIVCNQSYFMTDEGLCQPCDLNCAVCYGENSCKLCNPGATLSSDTQFSKCILCQDPCQTCSKSPQNCQTCVHGYYLSGWSCVSVMTLHFRFVLNGYYSLFDTISYAKIESQLLQITAKTQNKFHIISISMGSIILEGSIDVIDNADFETTSNRIKQNFFKGQTLSQYYILQATLFDPREQQLVQGNSTSTNNLKQQDQVFKITESVLNKIISHNSLLLFALIILVIVVLYKYRVICRKDNPEPTQATQESQVEDSYEQNEFEKPDLLKKIINQQFMTLTNKIINFQDTIQKYLQLIEKEQFAPESQKNTFFALVQQLDEQIQDNRKKLTENQYDLLLTQYQDITAKIKKLDRKEQKLIKKSNKLKQTVHKRQNKRSKNNRINKSKENKEYLIQKTEENIAQINNQRANEIKKQLNSQQKEQKSNKEHQNRQGDNEAPQNKIDKQQIKLDVQQGSSNKDFSNTFTSFNSLGDLYQQDQQYVGSLIRPPRKSRKK